MESHGEGHVEGERQETGRLLQPSSISLVSQISVSQYLPFLSGKTSEKSFLVKWFLVFYQTTQLSHSPSLLLSRSDSLP